MYFIETFKKEDYTFRHYCTLSLDEKMLVLKHRNKNRQLMLHQEEILLQDHLNWIDSLENDTTKVNYLVFKNDVPFMAIAYHDIDNKEAYWGYFLIDNSYNSEVLKIEKIIIDFAFDELNLDRLLCINDSENHVIKIHQFFGFKIIETKRVNNKEYTVMELLKAGK
jgi:UDP-4-amino-4,6-dideoxy-N-acetyl-beta-L-altrosamine N-acetyltransferase